MSAVAQTVMDRGAELTDLNYQFLKEYLYRESGLVLDNGKNYLLESRLIPILKRQKLTTLNDLCVSLQRNPKNSLHREVVEAMTTNETMFFRDPDLWHELKATVLPELIEYRKDSKRLRFWSAASSSGQEAHSLSMALLEMGLGGWDIKILGTDFSQQMVERASSGQYSQLEANRGLPAPYLVKYFTRNGLQWHIKEEVKRWVRFEQLDLRQKLGALGPFDIVFCRNVLIYFDVPTKQKILKEVREALCRGGHLILGSAETVLNLDTSFERRPIGKASFYRAP
ncbi:MAG: protein-glutamate O-methyltransferase CheR [Terriglobales bacterium]